MAKKVVVVGDDGSAKPRRSTRAIKPEVATKTTLSFEDRTVAIEVWRVTPAFARQELDRANIGNRSMKPLQVQQLKHDIEQGYWIPLTGDCIRYDDAGRLIDGQNRFQAISDADKPVHLVVWRDLAPEVKFVIDSGVARSGGDILGFAGEEKYLAVHSQALRMVAAWEAGYLKNSGVKTSRFSPWTKSDILDANAKHNATSPRLADSVAWAALNSRKERCVPIPTSSLAFLHYETSLIDADAAQEFWDGYANNEFPNRKGDPRWAMWNRLHQVHVTKAHNKVNGIYVFCGFRAWNLWRDGQEVASMLYYTTKTETLRSGRGVKSEHFYAIQEPH
jgi:hypothetical protein